MINLRSKDPADRVLKKLLVTNEYRNNVRPRSRLKLLLFNNFSHEVSVLCFFSYAVLITVLFGNNWREPILVKFRPIINQILEVSEVNQKIDIKMWFLHEWFDERLVWNPLEYGNITVLHIPADKVRTFSTFRVRSIKALVTRVVSIVLQN